MDVTSSGDDSKDVSGMCGRATALLQHQPAPTYQPANYANGLAAQQADTFGDALKRRITAPLSIGVQRDRDQDKLDRRVALEAVHDRVDVLDAHRSDPRCALECSVSRSEEWSSPTYRHASFSSQNPA